MISHQANAQDGGMAGAFSRMGLGPRGMAMGNALTAVPQHGIYSYYNPALAAHAPKGNQIDLATSAMTFDRSLHTLNSTFQLPPQAGATVSIINANVSEIDGRTSDGYHTGNLSTHQYQLSAAAGLRLNNKLAIGLGVKYYIADLHDNLDNTTTVGLDVGILYTLSDHFTIGATVQDLLASYNWDTTTFYGDNVSTKNDPFPTRFKMGFSYHSDQDITLSFDGGRATGSNQSTNFIRGGVAYQLHEYVTLRGGWQINDLSSLKISHHGSAGFSIHLPFDFLSPSIDYAFIQEPNNISYMHTFGIQLHL